MLLLFSFLSLIKKCVLDTICTFLAQSQPNLSTASLPSILIGSSTLKPTQPLRVLFATHIHVSARNSKVSKGLILTLFLSLHCACFCKSHAHVACVLLNFGSHRPLNHFECNLMQIYNRCLPTHSESEQYSCSLLPTALTLFNYFPLFTLGQATFRVLVKSLLSLPLPASCIFRFYSSSGQLSKRLAAL